MATYHTFMLLFFVLVISLDQDLYGVSGQQSAQVDYKDALSCKDGTSDIYAEFFNTITLACVQCSQNSSLQRRSSDGLTCECKPGYRYLKNFGGSKVECELCPNGVSDDGWECVNCSNRDDTTKKCFCTDNKIKVFRLLNGLYSNSTKSVDCQTCSNDTQPNADFSRCERCSITLSISATRNSCSCITETDKKKGICITGTDLTNPPASVFTIPLETSNTGIESKYMRENLEADYFLCKAWSNVTACQSLANMCVLMMYAGYGTTGTTTSGSSTTACSLFGAIIDTQIKPPIYVDTIADIAINNDDIKIKWTVDPVMTFPFWVGTYALDGSFEGFETLTASSLHLCNAEEKTINAAFQFGTYFKHSCSISALSLWNQVKYPLKFYEIYLKYTDTSQSPQKEVLYRIPIKIQNFKINGQNQALNSDIRYWQLMRRFFLVDSVTPTPVLFQSGTTCATQGASYVRYVKSIHLYIDLIRDQADGLINVPYFEIEYGDISRALACDGANIQVSFQVSYTMSQSSYNRNFQIATGVLCSLGLLYAGFRTYVWSRRAGRISIDFPTLANFIFYLCSSLSNCFFCIVFGIAFYFFIFYKRQNVVFLVHLEGQPYQEWMALFAAAFALKALALIHMIVMQCSVDLFMIDWERPKGGQGGGDASKKPQSSVSIWRTYFVANEWNEIQTKRKINPIFQIFAVVFFLHVVGFEDTTTKDPDGTVNKGSDVYMSEQSPMFRMALATLIYLIIGIVQVLFYVLIYERFITDDIREFVDICSMSNVSVFIMANGEYGYYIHGRSVHGCSDVGMDEMSEMIKREENDLVGQRGLVSGTDGQTFMMAIPKRLREKYMAVYMPVQLENATNRMGKSTTGKEKSIEAYVMLNRFFCAFIDHSLRDIDYVVKEKNFLEKILDTEFLELTDKGIFYYDNGHSFDNVLFYGNELMLLIFDVLLFCIVDLIFTNFVLAGIITYIISELICLIRDTAGKKNLAKKTLVDERFLI
ncbi:Meckelin [Biomphalaria glabrata]|uniref:Meckelin-like isoform X1 n=2 Tax=Biomphalaria glabrata TaxID=6526 RepID=A0A9W3B0F2_BIOGL|nr:meckelin-like isoform X1 [Biomphalaria glabrata]